MISNIYYVILNLTLTYPSASAFADSGTGQLLAGTAAVAAQNASKQIDDAMAEPKDKEI